MKRTLRIGIIAAMILCVAAVAWASSGGDGGITPKKLLNLLWRFITFVLVVGIIYKLAGKRLKEFFTGRSYQIESELKDLETRKAEAEKQMKEVENSISNLDQEREKILADFRSEGEKLKEAIIAKAQESAEKIKAQAQVSAEQEAKLAVEALRAEMADKITEAAEKMLKDKLSKDDHEKLVNEFSTKVVLN